jgi:DNA polymerase-3 subunit delta
VTFSSRLKPVSRFSWLFCYNIFMIAIEEIDKLRKENLSLITVVTGEDLGQFSQLKERMMAARGL